MTVSRAIRILLGLFALLIVAWAFVDVGARIWRGQQPIGEAQVELRIVHWGDNEEIEIVEAMLAEFRREHPDIVVRRIHAPDYWPKVKTMFASGDPPDVFYIEPQFLPELVDLELVRPIDDLVAAAGGYDAVLGDYYEVVVDAFRYDGQRVGEGPLYGIPKDFTTSIMYVNLDLFERAGVPVPYDGWTWAQYEDALRRISALSTRERPIWGGMLQLWPPSLLNVIWSYGGDYFATTPETGADFEDVTLDEPEALAAVAMIRRLRLEERTLYNSGAGVAEKDADAIFVRGDMGTLGPIGRWRTPLLRKAAEGGLRFDVVPVPHAPGQEPVSYIYTVAYAISTSTEHPQEAFELQRFLTGPRGAEIASRMGLAIPPMRSVAESEAFLDPVLPPEHDRIFLEAIDYARLQQFPIEYSRFDQLVTDAQQAALELGTLTPEQMARTVESGWLRIIRSPLRDEFPEMPWGTIGLITTAILAVAGVLIWQKSRREALGALDRAEERAGFAFIAPWLIGFAVLTVFPMVLSLLLAFTKWTAMTPLTSAQFVGAANFESLGGDQDFRKSLWVTLYYVVLAVPITQVLALAVALLMNVKARGIGVFRTIYFVPSVVSGVALAVLWLKLFNRDYGLVNQALDPIRWIGLAPPDWFGEDAQWAAIPAFVIMGLWGVGGGMVIYLAGLKNIPGSLYEAATIDGAGPLRRLWNVTIPMLSPLIFFNVVMSLIASFQIFTQAKVMTDGGPNGATLFYVLNLYRSAFEFHQMGYASAMAWILFVIILAATLLIFRGSRGLVHYEGMKV